MANTDANRLFPRRQAALSGRPQPRRLDPQPEVVTGADVLRGSIDVPAVQLRQPEPDASDAFRSPSLMGGASPQLHVEDALRPDVSTLRMPELGASMPQHLRSRQGEPDPAAGTPIVAPNQKPGEVDDLRASPLDHSARDAEDEARLTRARRGDIASRIIKALVGVGSGVMGAYGAASGSPGMAIAGQALANAVGQVPTNNRARVQGEIDLRNRHEQEDADRIEASTLRQLAAKTNAGNMLTGQENSRAAAERLAEQERRTSLDFNRRYANDSQAANAARDLLRETIGRYAAVVPNAHAEDYGDILGANEGEGSAYGIGAEDLEGIQRAVEQQIKTGTARRRTGGGGGGGAPRTSLSEPFTDPSWERLAQNMIRRNADAGTPITAEEARSTVRNMTDSARSDALTGVIGRVSTRTNEAQGQQEAADTSAEHNVPGWQRSPTAPRLSATERSDARGTVATWETVSTNIQKMQNLARQITAWQAAGGNAGLINQAVADAHALQEQISGALRVIGNYGVPNGTELQRMELLAPRLTTVDGLMNANEKYRALRSTLWTATQDKMGSLGYSRPSRGGAQ